MATVALRSEAGTPVCERCLIAETALARMRGLLGRRGIASGDGILLRPTSSVHTAFMLFPIDVVFLDRDQRVVRIVENLVPWRAAAWRRAHSALELAPGECGRRGIAVGDRLVAA